MSDDFDFDAMMADLEKANPLDQARTTKQVKAEVKHKCDDCDGTGIFKGRYRTVTPRKCVACGGRGWFKRSAADRAKDRAAYQASKKAKEQLKRDAFEESNPGLIDFLKENLWSDFFRSLLSSYEQYGCLTENQVRSARASQARILEKQAEDRKKKEEAKVVVDLATIKAMFDSAVASGLKRTKYRAEGLELTRAPDHGRNPGAIYVNRTNDSEYVGKVINGKFEPVRAASEEDKLAILKIAENPREAAVRWGQKTGTCSCCGRELTNAESIALGIGPICATKWGL